MSAQVFEPLVFFTCLSSEGVSISADWRISHCSEGTLNRIWRIYADWDPLFIRVPPFLRIMCGLEVFVFGPCYLISAMVLRCRVLPPWFPCFSLFFSGALFYSTVLYFAYEWLFAPSAYVNVTMVALVNAPWAILPCVLSSRVLSRARDTTGSFSSPSGSTSCFNSSKWN